MRLWAVAIAVVLTASARGVAADQDDEAFKRWATRLAEAEHHPICSWGALAHPDSKRPGRFVWFNDKTQPHANWLVFESGGRRWLFRSEERAAWGGRELRCEARAGRPWDKLDDLPLDFGEQSNVSDQVETITFLDGDLVMLSDNEVGYHDADRTSWIEGTHTWNDPHPLDDSPPEESQHMLFALPASSRWWAKVPPAPSDVTFGAKRWTGKPDADLSVRVLVVPQGLKVELSATDDRAVLPPADANPRAIVRADHFELWFCAENGYSHDCRGEPAQLAVARTTGGGALARWLRPHPRGAPVPVASLENDRLVVLLPRALIGAEPNGNGWPVLVPLTVAYSDSDDPAAGQQTMVATASIRRATPVSPSLLAVSDGDRPFPRWPRAKSLAPGEAIFAPDPECGEQSVALARSSVAMPLKSGAHADAAARLQTLVDRLRDRCTGRVSPDTSSGIYIDVALARHKAGDDAGCLVALRNIHEAASPAVVRAGSFNRALCGDPCKDEQAGCREGKAARAAGK